MMKLHATRLLPLVVVVAAVFSLSLDDPDLPGDPDIYHFQFGISLIAEDCADGSAEHQQCGSSFGIDPNLGGGGGGQRSQLCTWRWARTECRGVCGVASDPQRGTKKQATDILYCIDPNTDRIVDSTSRDVDNCCL